MKKKSLTEPKPSDSNHYPFVLKKKSCKSEGVIEMADKPSAIDQLLDRYVMGFSTLDTIDSDTAKALVEDLEKGDREIEKMEKNRSNS